MNQEKQYKYFIKHSYYFWLFVILHSLLWTIGPYLSRLSLPHDALEGITWGQQWQLGYPKHPFLTAWLCAGITELFGAVGWPIYLLAQITIATTFLAVWQLAKKILPAAHALIAVLSIEGVLFYNINSFNLTPDTLQSPLWALVSLFLYQALTTQKLRHWFLTGLLAALCICTKYQGVVLLVPMVVLCIFNPQARNSFRKPGIYLALFTFFIAIMPHLIWLFHHDFITLTYAQQVAKEYTPQKTNLDHLFYPLLFLLNNLWNTLGLFILIWPFYFLPKEYIPVILQKSNRPKPRFLKDHGDIKIDRLTWHFLISIGGGPFILSLLLCAGFGDYFPPRWSTPYFFPLGIIVIAWLRPRLSRQSMHRFALTIVLFSCILFITRMVSFILLPRVTSDAYLPNQTIALALDKLWQDRYHTPLPYLAGSNYLVSLTTPYIATKPIPYLNWDHQQSPWIDEKRLRHLGALFIWDEGGNFSWDKDSLTHSSLPKTIFNRFPHLIILPHLTFYRTSDNHPIVIGVGVLPPAK